MKSSCYKHITFFILFSWGLTCINIYHAQYKDTVHITDTQHEATYCYDWKHTFLTSISTLRDSNTVIYGWNYLQFKQYDEDFNVILETRLQDSSYYRTGRSVTYHQSAYYFSGLKYNSYNDTTEGILLKYDTIGNVIWEKTYIPTSRDVRLASVTSRTDGNLIILGNNLGPSQPEMKYTFLTLIDTSGNEIWTRTYNQVYSQQPISYKNTADGGGILATTHIINNTNYLGTAIYKLDANGNTQWQKIVGYQAPFQGPTVESWVAATEMPDGNYLCYGWKDDYVNGRKRSWLVKLSPTGAVLKDTVYDFSDGYDAFNTNSNPIFTETGFYMGGAVYDDINAFHSKFQFCYFDYDLNLQWSRKYWKREAENAIRPVKQLDNGFIAMAGFVFQDSPTNTADEWFMVVDSLGCETELCAQSIGINELMYQYTNAFNVTIYPNPAQDEVYLYVDEAPYENLNYTLVDISGKDVLQGATYNRNAIDISTLPNGYYVVSVLLDGNRINKSLIVSR
jgi:hypothetical protein